MVVNERLQEVHVEAPKWLWDWACETLRAAIAARRDDSDLQRHGVRWLREIERQRVAWVSPRRLDALAKARAELRAARTRSASLHSEVLTLRTTVEALRDELGRARR